MGSVLGSLWTVYVAGARLRVLLCCTYVSVFMFFMTITGGWAGFTAD